MSEAYLALCRELSIQPSTDRSTVLPRARSVDAAVSLRGSDSILEIDHPGGMTVALVAGDWSSGCPECVQSKIVGLEHYYPGDPDDPLDVEAAVALVSAFRERHGIPLAVTDAYAPQNWSVCFPVPGCGRCSGVARTSADLAASYGELWAGRTVTSTPAEHDRAAGLRQLSGSEFARGNRSAIGFTAVVGNPVLVDEDRVSLVNAPIFVSTATDDHEVSGGKGANLEQAIASCVGEGLERYFLTGVFRELGVVASRADLGALACSPREDFGFPAIDPRVVRYADDVTLEWVVADDLHTGDRKFVPANAVYCPYAPVSGGSVISVGSTNGAATGATVADATRQALLEAVERDAFWYYARTGIPPSAVSAAMLPPDVAASMSTMRGQFWTHVLENPFGIPVVHVTFESDVPGGSRAARGTGATLRLESSIRRAFSECLQMYHSLSTGVAVEPTTADMRHSWFAGRARTDFPEFFARNQIRRVREEPPRGLDPTDAILASAREQSLPVYRVTLVETPAFAVVKVLVGGMAIMDASYFENGTRFSDVARAVRHPEPRVRYRGSLFM